MDQSSPPTNIDMAALRGRLPLSLTDCMTQGQMTPPSSPPLPSVRNGPQLQLSRLLQRSRSRSTKPKQSGLFKDKCRTTIPRPSVTEMRLPLPLLLPESPSLTRSNSPTTIAYCSPGLRRMSASYNDLRALAQYHAVSSPLTPLLPSPITRESQFEARSFVRFHNPREQRPSISNDGSVDSLQILSYYCNDNDTNSYEGRADDLEEDTRGCSDRDTVEDDEESGTTSDSTPITPLDQDHQADFCSNESGWLANTTSHEERMRRFKARFYQIVQHPWTDVQREYGEDEVVGLSTLKS